MRVAIVTDGSRGDIQPFLALAHALRARGHVVLFITNESHAALLAPLLTRGTVADAAYFPVDYHAVFAENPAISSALAAGDEVRYMLALMDVWAQSATVVAPVARDAAVLFAPDALVSGTGPMAVSIPLSDLLNVPLFHATYLPLAFSCRHWPLAAGGPPRHAMPVARAVLGLTLLLAGLGPLGALVGVAAAPRLVNSLVFAAYEQVGSRLILDGYNAVRRVYGLKDEPRGTMWRRFQSEFPRIGSYSGSLFDCPAALREATGYWYGPEWEGEDGAAAAAAADAEVRRQVDKFCQTARRQGRKVISVGWGSMILLSRRHLSVLALASAAIADVSVVLIGGWAGISAVDVGGGGGADGGAVGEMMRDAEAALRERGHDGGLAEWAAVNALSVESVSHAYLFPLVDAVVLHGGSGTSHAVCRSGVPAITTQVLADQGGWGDRIERAGAGVRGPRLCDVGARALAGLVRKVVDDDRFMRAAQRLREQIVAERGAAEAVRRIEDGFAAARADHCLGLPSSI